VLPTLPAQGDELQELSLLARDAAEILWEMVAMGEGGAAVDDMKSKGQQLQAQLRGLIGDYQVCESRGHKCLACIWCGGRGRADMVAHGLEAIETQACGPCLTAGAAAFVCCQASVGPACCSQGGDETIFAKAFESFDMLSRCLEEVSVPQQPEQPPAAALAAPPAAVAAPAAAAPAPVSRPADEPPLISFD
jgi:hypothetical protein